MLVRMCARVGGQLLVSLPRVGPSRRRGATGWLLAAPLLLAPAVAQGQPAPAPTPASAEPAQPRPTVQSPDTADEPTAATPAAGSDTAAPQNQPTVDDAAWDALQGRQVIVETNTGPVAGELLRSDGTTLVLVLDDGRVHTMPKAQATGVRVAPAGAQPSPSTPTNPDPPSSTLPPSAPTKADPSSPPDTADADPEADEELTPGQQRRKERRENREHALLGIFSMHGATYSHWRGAGVNSGHASYAMDWGVGVNLSPRFGMYAMAGGLFGAKIDNGETKANYGHIAGMFTFGGKYYYSAVGAGVAFSRLRFADDTLHKDRGLALPGRLVGKIPLPKKLYLGIGLTYELGMVRGFDRFINAIGGQIVIGRW